MVQVEVDPSAVLTGRPAHVGVNADPVSFLRRLGAGTGQWNEWAGKMKQVRDAIIADERKDLADAALYEGLAAAVRDDDVLVVDGKAPARAARALLANGRHQRLFIMNHRDLAGPGLPFAIGVKLALPESPVTLVTDLDSLLRQPQELKTAEGLGLDLNVVVTDPGQGQRRERTEAVLGGLGCEVRALKQGSAPDREKRGRPSAWLMP
jgi:thiamine pyrophosphate-dependent acetolactate synthase large subunit-like protein